MLRREILYMGVWKREVVIAARERRPGIEVWLERWGMFWGERGLCCCLEGVSRKTEVDVGVKLSVTFITLLS